MPSTEARVIARFYWPEVLVNPTGPVGDRERRELRELTILKQLGRSLPEIRDTFGVPQEAVAGIGP